METQVAKWYCVRSKVKRERIVAQAVAENLGIEVYCPRIRLRRETARGRVWFDEALFPGYFFARFDLRRQLKEVSYSFGVTGLVRFGNCFVEVPPCAVKDLRDELGVEEVLVVNDECRQGEDIVIMEGPFKGLAGMVVDTISGKERVKVLIDFLGRSLQVEVDESILSVSKGK